jgi:hypothetical protein
MTVFSSQLTCNDKNSPEFERTLAVMHISSSWMLGEEKGLFRASPTIARGGRERDAVQQRGVVAAATT